MPRRTGLEIAARALEARDLSRVSLTRRLESAGVTRAEREDVVDRLVAAGLLDDLRLARARADRLAARGWGDARIAATLSSEGIEAGDVEDAVSALAPETERARALGENARSVPRRRLAARLTQRGFGDEAVAAALGCVDDAIEPELRWSDTSQ